MEERGARDLSAQFADRLKPIRLELPTGKIVIVGDPDLPTMALRGLIPDHLLPAVEKFVFDNRAAVAAANEPNQPPGEKLRRYAEFLQYVDVYAVAALREPRFTFDGADGTLPISVLTSAERMHIWQWGAGQVQALADFPDDGNGQTDAVPESPDGEGVRDATE